MKKFLMVLILAMMFASFTGCDYTEQVSPTGYVTMSQKDAAWIIHWLDNKLNKSSDD